MQCNPGCLHASEKPKTSIMKITSFVSIALALATFSCVTSINCPAENADKTAPEKDQRVYKLSELSHRPTPTKQADPDKNSFSPDEEHFAIVNLIVETNGTVAEATLEKSSSPQFGKAVLAAAKQWQFTPGLCQGKAVRTRISIPFKISRKK